MHENLQCCSINGWTHAHPHINRHPSYINSSRLPYTRILHIYVLEHKRVWQSSVWGSCCRMRFTCIIMNMCVGFPLRHGVSSEFKQNSTPHFTKMLKWWRYGKLNSARNKRKTSRMTSTFFFFQYLTLV